MKLINFSVKYALVQILFYKQKIYYFFGCFSQLSDKKYINCEYTDGKIIYFAKIQENS